MDGPAMKIQQWEIKEITCLFLAMLGSKESRVGQCILGGDKTESVTGRVTNKVENKCEQPIEP